MLGFSCSISALQFSLRSRTWSSLRPYTFRLLWNLYKAVSYLPIWSWGREDRRNLCCTASVACNSQIKNGVEPTADSKNQEVPRCISFSSSEQLYPTSDERSTFRSDPSSNLALLNLIDMFGSSEAGVVKFHALSVTGTTNNLSFDCDRELVEWSTPEVIRFDFGGGNLCQPCSLVYL